MQITLRYRQEHTALEVHAESGGYRVRIDGHDYRVETQAGSPTLIIDGVRHDVELVRHGDVRGVDDHARALPLAVHQPRDILSLQQQR